MSALIVAVNDPVSSTPSRLTVLNPFKEKVTVYVAGAQIDDAVLAAAVGHGRRVFSINASLDASTVTPGSTAPKRLSLHR